MRFCVGFFVFFFLFFNVANAQIVVSEIMYDLEGSDSGREWIEIQNVGLESVDLSSWKFFENDTNHKLVISQGSESVSPDFFAIIADKPDLFLADFPSFSGTLFDSSFSLKNSGETLIIRDGDLSDVDTVNYNTELGGRGDGNSLQLVGGVFTSQAPTPGEENIHEESVSVEVVENESSSVQEEVVTTGLFIVEPQIFAYAGNDRIVIVGADSKFQGQAFGIKRKPLEGARYLWNFGNGATKEGQNVLHHYEYPGKYVVILSVSSGSYSASDRVVVEALASDIEISEASMERISITNNSIREINLSWWRIKSGSSFFTIPENTIILPNHSLVFSYAVTGLFVTNPYNVALLYPNDTLAVSYEENPPVVVTNKERDLITEKVVFNSEAAMVESIKSDAESNEPIDFAINSSTEPSFSEGSENRGSILKWVLALIGIIGVSAVSAVMVRRMDQDEIEIIE
jgi:PKD repeat protein|tara:strand:+ start:6282 stop:7655 length:1374 start_codon:yes stop_codon:yes gene_type:complete